MVTTNKIIIENQYNVSMSAWETPFTPTTTCIAVSATSIIQEGKIILREMVILLSAYLLNRSPTRSLGRLAPIGSVEQFLDNRVPKPSLNWCRSNVERVHTVRNEPILAIILYTNLPICQPVPNQSHTSLPDQHSIQEQQHMHQSSL